MTKLHKSRLLKLAKHLREGKLAHKVFYFGSWNADEDFCALERNGCGYAGCAIGEMPALAPRRWRWKNGLPKLTGMTQREANKLDIRRGNIPLAGAMVDFGLTKGEAEFLFVFDEHGNNLTVNATRIQVAHNIEQFVKRNEDL
jgi:hypothetical protein